jgi:hypothetical protein
VELAAMELQLAAMKLAAMAVMELAATWSWRSRFTGHEHGRSASGGQRRTESLMKKCDGIFA